MFLVTWAGMAAKNIVIIRDEDFGVMWPETAKPEPINMETTKSEHKKATVVDKPPSDVARPLRAPSVVCRSTIRQALRSRRDQGSLSKRSDSSRLGAFTGAT